jgi:hypothetical protein
MSTFGHVSNLLEDIFGSRKIELADAKTDGLP